MMPEHVLLVEDDELMGVLFELVLVEAGYRVTRARDGLEALTRLAPDAPSVDGLITDIRLGEGPDGWQVALKARARFPDLPVIYISGAPGVDGPPPRAPWGVVLRKPFHVNQLVQILADLMDAEHHARPMGRLA